MKPSSIMTTLLALLLATTATFVACGASTNGDPASAGASGNAGQASTNGGAGAGASSGGSASHAGTAGAGAGGAGAGGAASASAGAAAGGAPDGGAAGAGGASFTDRCGGACRDGGQICILQGGGPGPAHFVCATQNPCGAAGACACIVDQGTCNFMPEGGSPGYCVCDNGLD